MNDNHGPTIADAYMRVGNANLSDEVKMIAFRAIKQMEADCQSVRDESPAAGLVAVCFAITLPFWFWMLFG